MVTSENHPPSHLGAGDAGAPSLAAAARVAASDVHNMYSSAGVGASMVHSIGALLPDQRIQLETFTRQSFALV